MYVKNIAVIVALSAASIGVGANAPAQAQVLNYGVEVSAETLGYPGTFRESFYLPNETSLQALSDPDSVVLSDVWGNSASADLGTAAEVTIGSAHAWASSETASLSGGQYNSASIYAFVESDSGTDYLPASN